MRILQRNLKRTYLIVLRNVKEKNVLLFKLRCNIFIGVRIFKEMPGSVASGTPCILIFIYFYLLIISHISLFFVSFFPCFVLVFYPLICLLVTCLVR